MKASIQLLSLAALLLLTSCGHFRHCGDKKQQCEMKKENCPAQCDMKKTEAPAEQKTEAKK